MSLAPLGLVAVSFFLPAVETCGQVSTPVHEIAKGAWWGLPPFVMAVVLLVATTVAIGRARRRPRHRRLWLGPYRQHPAVLEPRPAPGRSLAFAVSAAATAGVLLTALSAVIGKPNNSDFVLSCAALYLGLLWSGVSRLDAWRRWAFVLLSWAVQAALPVGLVMASGALNPRTPGATVYVLAVATVIGATVWALGQPVWKSVVRWTSRVVP